MFPILPSTRTHFWSHWIQHCHWHLVYGVCYGWTTPRPGMLFHVNFTVVLYWCLISSHGDLLHKLQLAFLQSIPVTVWIFPEWQIFCKYKVGSWGGLFFTQISLSFGSLWTVRYWCVFAAFIPWRKCRGSTCGDYQGSGYSNARRNQVYESQLHRVQVPSNQGSSMAQSMFFWHSLNTWSVRFLLLWAIQCNRALCWLSCMVSTTGVPQTDATRSSGLGLKASSILSKPALQCGQFSLLAFLIRFSYLSWCHIVCSDNVRKHYYYFLGIVQILLSLATILGSGKSV